MLLSYEQFSAATKANYDCRLAMISLLKQITTDVEEILSN